MVSMLALNVVDHGFEILLGQTKVNKMVFLTSPISIAALRRMNKDWLAPNQDNVSKWSDISTCRLA